MRPICKRLAVALVVLPLAASGAAAQEKSPYQRLGGYDAIAGLFDEFVGRLVQEEQLKRFFAGHSTSSEMRQRQLVLDLVCQVTGGPCLCIGRDLKVAHAGLGITKADWDLVSKRFVETDQPARARARAERAGSDHRAAREGHRREAVSAVS